MDIQTVVSILFVLALTVFLAVKRKDVVVQKMLFPILYFAMYRTNWGLTSMSAVAKKCARPIKYLSFCGILIGFVGMVFIVVELGYNIYRLIMYPGGIAGVGIIQPFAPHIPGTIFVPFFYFVIAVFIIAIIHEFSHGITARTYNLRIKSSGFAFLGIVFPILPAAFVEPDEKQIKKKPALQQLSIYAAGPFSNILFAFAVLAVIFIVFSPISAAMLEMQGVLITDFLDGAQKSPAQTAGMKKGELITQINGVVLTQQNSLSGIIQQQKPGDTIVITTNESVYRVIAGENNGRAVLGVMAKPYFVVKEVFKQKYGNFLPKVISWFAGLFEWLFILSLGIGLFNLVPLGPIDGGRMLRTALHKFLNQHKAERIFVVVSSVCLSALLFNIVLAVVR